MNLPLIYYVKLLNIDYRIKQKKTKFKRKQFRPQILQKKNSNNLHKYLYDEEIRCIRNNNNNK